jgi:hypothetical protein
MWNGQSLFFSIFFVRKTCKLLNLSPDYGFCLCLIRKNSVGTGFFHICCKIAKPRGSYWCETHCSRIIIHSCWNQYLLFRLPKFFSVKRGIIFTVRSQKKFFVNLKKRLSRSNFIQEIDCTHFRSLKMLSWPWFRENIGF